MARRLPFGSEANKWEFPGGKVEPGEDPRDSLERELNEELGINVTAGRVLDLISEIKDGRHLVLIYFHCRIVSGEPIPLQCQTFRWLAPTEIDGLEMPPADARFWRKLKNDRLMFK